MQHNYRRGTGPPLLSHLHDCPPRQQHEGTAASCLCPSTPVVCGPTPAVPAPLPASAWDSALLPGPAAGLRTPHPGIGSCCSRTCSTVRSPASAALPATRHPQPHCCLCCCSGPGASHMGWPRCPQCQLSPVPVAVHPRLRQPWWWSGPRARMPPVLLRGTGSCEHAGSQIPVPTALVPAACPLQCGLRPKVRGTGVCFSYLQRYPAPSASYTCSATEAKGVASVPAAHVCAALLGSPCQHQARLALPRPKPCCIRDMNPQTRA